jgi:hypothetical protein
VTGWKRDWSMRGLGYDAAMYILRSLIASWRLFFCIIWVDGVGTRNGYVSSLNDDLACDLYVHL